MRNEKLEVVFIEGMEEDFIKYKIKEEEILKIEAKIKLYSDKICSMTQPIKNIKENIRKFRWGKYRLFLHIKDYTIYCLAFLHRKECYKKESINRTLTAVRNIGR